MRLALAALVLALASGPLCAQRTVERAEAEKPKETKKAPAKVLRSAPPELPQDRVQKPRPSHDHKHSAQPQRALEPPKAPPARTAAPERPTSPPSPAVLQQRKLDEERRLQLKQQEKDWRRTMDDKRADEKRASSVRCNAFPVCKRGGYGSCRGVEQSYASASVGTSRQAMVRQCVEANTPDSCDCVSQCSRVAHCSIF